MGEEREGWRRLGWNGVTFRHPGDWEIGELGDRYLLLEDDRGPRFELRWEPPVKRFSHRRVLGKLGGARLARRGAGLEASPLPESWETALGGFSARGFIWQAGEGKPAVRGDMPSASQQNPDFHPISTVRGGTPGSPQENPGPHPIPRVRGGTPGAPQENSGPHSIPQVRGGTLRCGACGGVLLFQFHRLENLDDERMAATLLATLEDHGEGERLWCVYDIRAKLPDTFALSAYRFSPGRFEVDLSGPDGARLSIRRWSPASVLIPDGDLQRFAELVFGEWDVAERAPASETISGHRALSWEWDARAACGGIRGWWRRLRGKEDGRRLALWHLEKVNRLFAVRAEGPVDGALMKRVCRDFETV